MFLISGAVRGFFSRFGGRNVPTEVKLASELDDYSAVTSDEEVEDPTTDEVDHVEHTGTELFNIPSVDLCLR